MWVKLRAGINSHKSIDFHRETPNDMSQEPSIPPLQLLQNRKAVRQSQGLSLHIETFASSNTFEF